MDFPKLEGMEKQLIFDSHAHYDDKKFDSCMRDTIAVLNKRPTLRGTEV